MQNARETRRVYGKRFRDYKYPAYCVVSGILLLFFNTRLMRNENQELATTKSVDVDIDNRWWLGRDNADFLDNHPNLTNPETWIFPRVGARHPNGTLGMVVNPSVERLLSPLTSLPLSREQVFGEGGIVDREVVCPKSRWGGDRAHFGIEGERGNEALVRIRRGIGESVDVSAGTKGNERRWFPNLRSRDETTGGSRRKSKILCMVYTVYLPNDRHSNLRAQAGTWGKRCDGFFAASNMTDHSLGAIDLPHLGPEAYGNMWQKVRAMWAYAYQHFSQDYDWFHICGDDTYVAVDNLRAYVDGPEIGALEDGKIDRIFRKQNSGSKFQTHTMRPRPLLLGIPMRYRKVAFPSGGPGYTINRAALEILGEKILPNYLCSDEDSREDVFVGKGFHENGVYISDTRDAFNATRYGGSVQNGVFYDGIRSVIQPEFLKRRFGLEYATFENFPSSQQIGFHMKDDKQHLALLNRTIADSIYRYHAFLYNLTDVFCAATA